MSSFLRDGELITSDSLDLNTESHSIADGLLSIFTGKAEDGEEICELETVGLNLVIITLDFFESNGQGMETTHGEHLNIGLKPVLSPVGLVAGADSVEWLEVEDIDTDVGLGRRRRRWRRDHRP